MTISPDRILKELAQLWVDEAKVGSGASVLRACSMTLIVAAEEGEDAAGIGETIAALMPEHPARTVLIRLCGNRQRALSERVYAQCWMPFGQRRQICCEQVEITAADTALPDLPSVVLPLAVADLPVILWCRTPRLLGMPEFGEMAAMATKVIVDSGGMPDARDAIRRIADASARGVFISDLAWTRLTRWRESIWQQFETREQIGPATIEYGRGWETSARYMAAWLGGAVELRAGDTTLRMEPLGELAPRSEYLLMREELGIVRRDSVFERTLQEAAAR